MPPRRRFVIDDFIFKTWAAITNSLFQTQTNNISKKYKERKSKHDTQKSLTSVGPMTMQNAIKTNMKFAKHDYFYDPGTPSIWILPGKVKQIASLTFEHYGPWRASKIWKVNFCKALLEPKTSTILTILTTLIHQNYTYSEGTKATLHFWHFIILVLYHDIVSKTKLVHM